MRAQQLGYAVAITALVAGSACNRSTATHDNRVDKEANERAAQVTNTTDNKEGAAAGVTRDQQQATATTGTFADDSSDGRLTTKVHSKLMDDKVMKQRRIDVDAKGGVVTLKGSVASKLEHDRAEQLARDTAGVTQVVNNLMIDANVEQHDVNDNHRTTP
jgi:hyperosmotically inducible protein